MATQKLPETTVRTDKPKTKNPIILLIVALYMLINPDGVKRWQLDYTFKKKCKTISLGVHPKVARC